MKSIASTARSRTVSCRSWRTARSRLIGATTENPRFELNAALLSRARVLIFRALDEAALEKLLARAETVEGKPLPLDPEAREALLRMADGDGRAVLTLAEEIWRAAPPGEPLRYRRL